MVVHDMNVVIYRRISSDPEGRQVGIENQEKACRERAESRGWTVVNVFTDNDVSASAKSRKARRDYLQMLDEAQTSGSS